MAKRATEGDLTKFQNAIRGGSNPKRAISKARSSLPQSLYPAAIAWLRRTPLRGELQIARDFPNDWGEMFVTPILDRLPLPTALQWAWHKIQPQAERIEAFVHTSAALSGAFLSSDHRGVTSILDEIDSSFGPSIFSLKLRFAATARRSTFEAQKALLATVTQSAPKSGLVQYLANYLSVKHEQTLTYGSFKNLYKRHLSAQQLSPDLERFARFHLLPTEDLALDEYADVLSVAETGSLVDLYECVLRILGHIVYLDGSAARAFGRALVREMNAAITDVRMESLQLSADPTQSRLPKLDLRPLNLFIQGKFAEAFEACLDAIRAGHFDWQYLELAARSGCAGNKAPVESNGNLVLEIIADLHGLLARNERSTESAVRLLKHAANYDPLLWADQIDGFLLYERTCSPVLECLPLRPSLKFGPTALNPFSLASCNSEIVSRVSDVIASAYDVQPCVSFMRSLLSNAELEPDQCDCRNADLLAVDRAFLVEDYSRALQISKRLVEDTSVYFQHKGIRARAWAFYQGKQLKECIYFTISTYLRNHYIYPLLPVRELVTTLSPELRSALKHDLSLPILLHIYSEHFGAEYDTQLGYAYEDWLQSQGVSRPTQLAGHCDRYDPAQLIYFLREICIPDILETSIEFSSSAEIQEERIGICQLLLEIDATSAVAYEDEIKGITTEQAVQRSTLDIEQAKIYVDLDRVRKAAIDNSRDAYVRYRSFVDNDIGGAQSVALYSAGSTSHPTAILPLPLPVNERYGLLYSLVAEIRDEFVSSAEHGLDGFLSLRVRHGTLSGQFRSPLEAARLITQKEAGSQKYKPNVYWGGRLLTTDAQLRQKVADRLADFSSEFDKAVEQIKREWIQIRRADDGVGLFDFRITDNFLRILEGTLRKENTFEDFVDTTLQLLWQLLDELLRRIREKLSTEGKQLFDSILAKMEHDIVRLTSGVDAIDLHNAIISARTDMRRTIDRVVGWFDLPIQKSQRPFPISHAIKTAAAITNKLHRHDDLTVSLTCESDPVYPGLAFVGLVDVFTIVFDNIVRHCGQAAPVAEALLRSRDGAIQIRIENTIDASIRTSAAEERIRLIKDSMDRGEYKRAVSSEGGTGFFKIRKILRHDLGTFCALDFGFSSGASFFVELEIREVLSQ